MLSAENSTEKLMSRTNFCSSQRLISENSQSGKKSKCVYEKLLHTRWKCCDSAASTFCLFSLGLLKHTEMFYLDP